MPRRKKKPAPSPPREADRITYRDLRNTPGRVFERLADGEPLTLVADGAPRALLIPIPDGDVATARDAYARGRALLALRRIQDRVRREGTSERLTLAEINRVIREVRRERAREDTD